MCFELNSERIYMRRITISESSEATSQTPDVTDIFEHLSDTDPASEGKISTTRTPLPISENTQVHFYSLKNQITTTRSKT